MTYRTLDRRCDMGPASTVRCIEDLPLERTGELVARTLGIDGMINVNVIRDAEAPRLGPRRQPACLGLVPRLPLGVPQLL